MSYKINQVVHRDPKGFVDFEKTCREFADALMLFDGANDIVVDFNVFSSSEMARDMGEE